jgi:thiosulfate dehydrogenase
MHMKGKWLSVGMIVSGVALIAAACGQATATDAPPTEPPPPPPAEAPTEVMLTGSVTVGGKLYDKWWSVAEVDEPSEDQPLWSTQTTNTRSGSTTWRCKECHGWDYKGADGAYGSGSHFTGFAGVLGSAPGMSHGELLAWLDGSTDGDHDFSAMGDEAMANLVVFLSEGLIDVGPFIDAETKAAVGADEANGKALYDGTCAVCHGADGRTINFHDPDEPEFVGNIAVDNPWEFIHKVRAGQPGAPMPSSIDNGWSMQDVVDVLGYAQTLPTEPPTTASVSRGGRLYDKWWKVAGLDEPTEDNPVWARQDTNTRSGDDTWRCKECHGWDYQGAAGAYGSGSHFTGFPGVLGAADKSAEDLIAQITGGTDPEHDFSAMAEADVLDLVEFLKEGLVDVSPFIDAETKAAIGGDAANGETLYMSTCTVCHGEDGRLINFHDPEEPEFVGNIAVDNPWEFIHKVRAGQPGTSMPSSIDNGWSMQDVIDVLTFSQTLPTDPP